MRPLRRAGGIVLESLSLLMGMAGCRLTQHAPASLPSAALTTRNLDASQTLWAFVSQFTRAS